MGIASFLFGFAANLLFAHESPLLVTAATLVLVVGAGVGGYFIGDRKRTSPDYDLVINTAQETLQLPAARRARPIVISLKSVDAIETVTSYVSRAPIFHTAILWRNGDQERETRVRVWMNIDDAQAFESWLRETLHNPAGEQSLPS